MENNTPNVALQKDKPKKEILKWIVLGFFLLICVPLIIVAVSAKAQDAPYEPLSSQAQITYDASRIALCESEKNLANAKLMDVANGVEMDVDLNELNNKRDMDCHGF